MHATDQRLNKGCTTIEGEPDKGMKVKFVSQVGQGMKKLLISVGKAVESGSMVIFGANVSALRQLPKLEKIEDNVIVGVKSGTRGVIKSDTRGDYVYPVTIKRKKKSPTDMDIGFAGTNKFSAIAEESEEDVFGDF